MNNTFQKILPFKVAIWTVISLSSLIIVFHFLVLLQINPFENVCGGNLKTVSEMYVYESFSIAVNCLLIIVVLVKGQLINLNISPKVINSPLWIFVILFILNTLGNLASRSSLETMVATPLTFIFALLCLRIVTDTKRK